MLMATSVGITGIFSHSEENSGTVAVTTATRPPQKEYSSAFQAIIGNMTVPEVEPGTVYRTINEWYSMEKYGHGYCVGTISDDFKAAIQDATEFVDSDGNRWRPGDPLPNPGDAYRGKPIFGAAGTFNGLETNLAVDLTRWDCSNWVYFNNLFVNSNIAEVNLAGCDLHYVTHALTLFRNCSVGKIDMRGVSLSWAVDVPDDIGLFTQSTIGYLDIRGMTFRKIDSLFADCRIGALNAANCQVDMVMSAKNMFKNSEIHALDLSNWEIYNLYEADGFLDGAIIGDEYQEDSALLALRERYPNQEWLAFEELAAPVLDLSTWRGRTSTLADTELRPKNKLQIILPQ